MRGTGTWHEYQEQRVVYEKDENGGTYPRYEYYNHQTAQTHGFRYKFNVFNTPMHITYNKEGRGFFKKSHLHFTAANAFALDVPLFKVMARTTFSDLLTPSHTFSHLLTPSHTSSHLLLCSAGARPRGEPLTRGGR